MDIPLLVHLLICCEHCIVSTVFAIMNNAAMNIHVQVSMRMYAFVSLGGELLGHVVTLTCRGTEDVLHRKLKINSQHVNFLLHGLVTSQFNLTLASLLFICSMIIWCLIRE